MRERVSGAPETTGESTGDGAGAAAHESRAGNPGGPIAGAGQPEKTGESTDDRGTEALERPVARIDRSENPGSRGAASSTGAVCATHAGVILCDTPLGSGWQLPQPMRLFPDCAIARR